MGPAKLLDKTHCTEINNLSRCFDAQVASCRCSSNLLVWNVVQIDFEDCESVFVIAVAILLRKP